jgi:hypothetical protein
MIMDFVKSRCLKVCDIAAPCLVETPHDLLVDCVWSPIANSLVENVGFMFSSASPVTFHKSFTTTHKLVTDLQSYGNDSNKFTESKSYIEFQMKWQLSVYYQLRLVHLTKTK